MSWLRPFDPPDVPVPVLLYTRRGCPLCRDMHAAVRRARLPGCRLEVVDVDGDPALRDEYGWRVPVLTIGGRLAFEGHLEPAALRRRYAVIAKLYRAELLHGKEPG